MPKVKELTDRNVDIVVVLDESGSMGSIKSDVIGSFNQFLKTQKEDGDDAFITLVKFNDSVTRVIERDVLSKAAEINDKTYTPCGTTALYDAIANAISFVASKNTNNKVIVAIITDGYENSSKESTKAQIQNLIKAKEDLGWEFVFLAANMDACSISREIGISRGMAQNFSADASGVKCAFSSYSASTTMYRSSVRNGNDAGAGKEENK